MAQRRCLIRFPMVAVALVLTVEVATLAHPLLRLKVKSHRRCRYPVEVCYHYHADFLRGH